jgi:hypothetical protein
MSDFEHQSADELTRTLHAMLQTAIELEHATIPVYLYSLFSLKPGTNLEVARTLRRVVVEEEMLHLVLVCNLLNGVKGSPLLNDPGFVPTYPGHLPGGIRPELEVHLRPFSIEHARQVLMGIEMPEEILEADGLPPVDTAGVGVDDHGSPTGAVAEAASAIHARARQVVHEPLTIGWYYQQILLALSALHGKVGDSMWAEDRSAQLTAASWRGAPGRLYAVTDLPSAVLAIHEIVRQGEGATAHDPLGRAHEPAHYFQFAEIVEGRRFVRSGSWGVPRRTGALRPCGGVAGGRRSLARNVRVDGRRGRGRGSRRRVHEPPRLAPSRRERQSRRARPGRWCDVLARDEGEPARAAPGCRRLGDDRRSPLRPRRPSLTDRLELHDVIRRRALASPRIPRSR